MQAGLAEPEFSFNRCEFDLISNTSMLSQSEPTFLVCSPVANLDTKT